VPKGEAQKFEVIKGRSRVKIHSGEAKIFQDVRSRRSSALVSRKELSKFRNQKIWKKLSEICETSKREILKSSGPSIERGHVERDHHFTDSQSGKVKGWSREDSRNMRNHDLI
jgi:hypothetical protein